MSNPVPLIPRLVLEWAEAVFRNRVSPESDSVEEMYRRQGEQRVVMKMRSAYDQQERRAITASTTK